MRGLFGFLGGGVLCRWRNSSPSFVYLRIYPGPAGRHSYDTGVLLMGFFRSIHAVVGCACKGSRDGLAGRLGCQNWSTVDGVCVSNTYMVDRSSLSASDAGGSSSAETPGLWSKMTEFVAKAHCPGTKRCILARKQAELKSSKRSHHGPA